MEQKYNAYGKEMKRLLKQEEVKQKVGRRHFKTTFCHQIRPVFLPEEKKPKKRGKKAKARKKSQGEEINPKARKKSQFI